MELRYMRGFLNDYDQLTDSLKQLTDSCNPRHPSLRVKKMKGHRNIWEARITEGFRFTFSMQQAGEIILRRVGGHDVLKRP